VNEPPPNEADEVDEVDEQYRRAAARDASGPRDSVRHAILRHAAELAAQRAAQGGPVQSDPDQNAPGARRSGELSPVKLDFKQPAANETRWRPAAYGGLAAAALAGLLIAPHFLPPSPAPAPLPPTSSSLQAAVSASKKTEAAPTTPMETAPSAQGVTTMPTTAMRPRTLTRNEAIAPRADAPAGTSSVSSAASDAVAGGATRANAAAGAATASATGSLDKAAPPLAAKPRAFADEAPPAPVVGSAAVATLAAVRPHAPIDSATALRQAAKGGDTSRLKALLDEPIDVDARDPAGRTALMLAVIGGQAQAVEALLARGADPNAADSSGTTPLAAALAANHADITAALRRAGAH
jgi:Ankyrin repeats (many copies)